jgi:hypothetical protein
MANLDELLKQLGLGGVARNRAGQIVTNTNDVIPGAAAGLADMLYGAGRGTLVGTAAIGGLQGDINKLYVDKFGALFPNQPAYPTSEQISQAVKKVVPSLNLSKGNTGSIATSLGENIVSPIVSPAAAELTAKGAVASGKYAAPVIGGLLDDYATKTGLQMYAYRPTTPKKPDPSVGTRFEREYIGGLADKKPVKIEDYKNSSLMIMPWDSTSRNMKIKSVSDIVLPEQYITHGGQDYARDLWHMSQNIAGASNRAIANRIVGRADVAKQENLLAGGSGNIIQMPSTMGEFSENFSVQPISLLLGIADSGKLSKATIKAFDQSVRDFKVPTGIGEKRVVTQPFKDFKGIMTEEGRAQIYDPGAGELRKAVTNRFYLKSPKQNFQQQFGFNAEDVIGSITDESLLGVPKGYIGNTVILSPREGMKLTRSANPTYDTDFSGLYQGTLGTNVPVEVLMPKTFERIAKELSGKKADLRTMTLGALEKRKEGVSEMIDDRVIESYYNYLKGQKAKGLLD